MPGGWGQSVERASSPDSGRCTWGSRPHPLQGGPEPGLSAGPGTAGGGGLGGSIRAGPRVDLPRGTSPPLGTRVAGPGLRGSYLTSRRIFGRRCAVGTTGRWGRSRRDPTPRPLQRARAGCRAQRETLHLAREVALPPLLPLPGFSLHTNHAGKGLFAVPRPEPCSWNTQKLKVYCD